MKAPKYKKTIISHSSGDIQIYAKQSHVIALQIISEMKVFEGTKILSLIAEVYRQGKKEGAKSVFESIDEVKKQIPHKNPGKPKKEKQKKV